MNNLKVLLSNNTNNLFEYSIKTIKPYLNDLSKENIIIVPDKLSLITEQSIFNILNIDSYFNLSVMGISKFAKKIIEDNNIKILECTEIQSKLLTLKAIQNVKHNFKCFSSNYTLGLVDEIFAKISQIKSSNANINDLLDESAGTGTKLKYEDIKLIYNEYEKLRGNKVDSGELLSILSSILNQNSNISNYNVYFIGFDSLTKQGIQVLKNVTKNANYTQISVVVPQNQNNYRIYDETFLDSIINACKTDAIECETEWISTPFQNEFKNSILNNLFSRRVNFDVKNNFFDITKLNSSLEEIDICAKRVNYLLKTKKLKFNDIAICAPQNYHQILKTKLNNLNIDVFCDSSTPLYDLEVIKYLFNIIKFSHTHENNCLLAIISNDFCDLKKDEQYLLISLVNKFGNLEKVKKYADIENNNINEFINYLLDLKIEKNTTVNNYINYIRKITDKSKIIDKISEKCKFFEENGEIMLQKTFLQVEDKLESCLNSIELSLSETLKFEDFIDIFEKVLLETEITCVPSKINQVFIGDSKSFYFNKPYIFMLGMNEGVIPISMSDLGLISDKEILSDTITVKLEPTIQIINKRNKFKVFEILLSATKKCFLSYHTFSEDGRACQANEFISELKFLYKNKEQRSSDFLLEYSNNENLLESLCFNLQNTYQANLELANNQNKKHKKLIENILKNTNKLTTPYKPNKINLNFLELFFNNNKASISIIEKYNGCPKASFLANGLKLKKQDKDKIEANLIGTYIHEVGELFVKHNKQKLGTLSKEEINNITEEINFQMLKNEKYFIFTLKEHKFLLGLLKKESLRFCEFINYEQTISEFKPKYTEKYFGGENGFKPIEITVNGENFKISGVVDRIDTCDDFYRIIDYKTGNASNSKGAENLFYGTKVQLFVYAKAVEQNLNKQLFGAFYLPIKNGFKKDNKIPYEFSGFFENSVNKMILCDKNLTLNGKSDIINVTLLKEKKGKELAVRKKQNILPKSVLSAYCNYAIEIVKQTISDIKNGFIDCSPIKDRCKICEFNTICKYAFNEKFERQEIYDITSEKFLEILNEE